MRIRTPSFRIRILLVVLTVAVIPLALIGLWLTRSASRSGQELLRSRLDQALDRVVTRVGTTWLRHRSDLLTLGDDSVTQRALLRDPRAGAEVSSAPSSLQQLFDALDPAILHVTVRDTVDRVRWELERTGEDRPDPTAAFRITLPIHQRFPARWIGNLVVRVALEELITDAGVTSSLAGLVLGGFDIPEGTSLLPLPFDPALLSGGRFTWGGDEWLTAERAMSDPALSLVAAAPLSPFAVPFEQAARRGTLLLAVVAVSGVLMATVITRRMTRSLERLATAAKSVSAGNLETRIDEAGTDEVGQVARAFNSMTSSLQRTMRELADRERLAAVGEFAASLAHEVRNPLTAIRIDLQRVEEALPPDSTLRKPQSRALKEIERLDATVAETLDVARNGRWRAHAIELRGPLEAAAHAARPAFVERGATLDVAGLPSVSVRVRGDPSTLEQVFLNLFLNAAAALGPTGYTSIAVEEEGDDVIVSVRDTGVGIPREDLERVFAPLFTTRSDGTGLGLTVAQRVVEAHDGRIEIESQVDHGTTVRVHLRRDGNREQRTSHV